MSAAFGRDLVELLPRMRRFAFALSGSWVEADDLVQAACERALRNADRFEPGTRMDSWLYRIVQNLWLDDRRRAAVRGHGVDPELAGLSDDGRSAREPGDRLELARVSAAIVALPEAQRAVLALVAVEGLSYRETAEVLDVPIGTVMSRLARARDALHRQTGGFGGG